MDRGAWRAIVHGVAKSRTRLSDWHTHHLLWLLGVRDAGGHGGDTSSVLHGICGLSWTTEGWGWRRVLAGASGTFGQNAWASALPGLPPRASQAALGAQNLPADAGDTADSASTPGWGRSPAEGNGNPLQYSCLEDSVDRGAWRATIHGVAESRTRLSD